MKTLYIAPTIKVRKINVPSLMNVPGGSGERPDVANAKSGGFCDFDDIDEESSYSNSAW